MNLLANYVHQRAIHALYRYVIYYSNTFIQSVIIHNCRRIAVEFIHYIIASRALKKVSMLYMYIINSYLTKLYSYSLGISLY